jgi:hypothetical protein
MFLLTEGQPKYVCIKNGQLPLHLEKSQHALARTWQKHQISSCHFHDIWTDMTIQHTQNGWERNTENEGDKGRKRIRGKKLS